MPGLAAEETTCRFEGSYHHKERWNPFSGEVIVKPDGIVIGRDLSDPNSSVQSFDIDGFIALWNDRLTMIFLKRYQNPPNIKWTTDALSDVYYHLYRTEPGELFEGKWEGWYSVATNLPAFNKLYEVLLGFVTVEEVEMIDFRQGSISPLVSMKDELSGRVQPGIRVKLELSLAKQ